MTTPLRHLLLLLAAVCSCSGLSAQTISSIESLGNDTYSVTATATTKFTRNTTKLKASAIEAATQFCTKEGRHFKLVSATEHKSMYLVGEMATTKIVFKALKSGDQELAGPTVVPASPTSTATDSLYDELIKLDDLRKKGILTDDEFAVEKKKILARSK